jgi:hypothetical protein
MEREWYDTAILAIYIVFGYYKGIRLDKTSRLAWSFASYNHVVATVFLTSIFILPLLPLPDFIEGMILTGGRLSLVAGIGWCIFEVECVKGTIPWLWKKIQRNRRKLMYIGGGLLLLILVIILLVWVF